MTATLAVDTSRIPWERAEGYPAGTERKVLRRGPDDTPRTVILKLPPHFSMERHSHVMDEHHYVLEGSVEAEGQFMERGSYQLIAAHADHGPFRSVNGAEILVIWID